MAQIPSRHKLSALATPASSFPVGQRNVWKCFFFFLLFFALSCGNRLSSRILASSVTGKCSLLLWAAAGVVYEVCSTLQQSQGQKELCGSQTKGEKIPVVKDASNYSTTQHCPQANKRGRRPDCQPAYPSNRERERERKEGSVVLYACACMQSRINTEKAYQ